MLGTIQKTASTIELLYEQWCNAQRNLWRMGHLYRSSVLSSYNLKKARKDRKALKRCVELSRLFRVVKIDESCERLVNTTTGETIKTRLVFSCNLPLKAVTTQRVKGKNGKEYDLKAQTPLPTKEALLSLSQHKHRFDKIALWWVPNAIIAEEVVEKDPILVGKIDTHFHGQICFEICRWIDESVEDSYWAKEGY